MRDDRGHQWPGLGRSTGNPNAGFAGHDSSPHISARGRAGNTAGGDAIRRTAVNPDTGDPDAIAICEPSLRKLGLRSATVGSANIYGARHAHAPPHCHAVAASRTQQRRMGGA